jgi:hypothetical protein
MTQAPTHVRPADAPGQCEMHPPCENTTGLNGLTSRPPHRQWRAPTDAHWLTLYKGHGTV